MVNLKYPNEECFTHHLNMETIKQVTYPFTPNRYLGSLDIKDVFFSVPIYDAHEKLFCLCVRYTRSNLRLRQMDAKGIFTKLLLPPLHIWELEISSIIYVDYSLLAAESCDEFISNIEDTRTLPEKAQFPQTPR